LSGKYSIIDTNWIVSCFNENEFFNWAPENILFLSKEHQLLMDEKFDEYGDSYSDLATVESLHRAMDRVELHVINYQILFLLSSLLPKINYNCNFIQDDLVNPKGDTFLEFQKELFDQEQCFKTFEKCHAYFDDLNLVSFIILYFLFLLLFKLTNLHIYTSG